MLIILYQGHRKKFHGCWGGLVEASPVVCSAFCCIPLKSSLPKASQLVTSKVYQYRHSCQQHELMCRETILWTCSVIRVTCINYSVLHYVVSSVMYSFILLSSNDCLEYFDSCDHNWFQGIQFMTFLITSMSSV